MASKTESRRPELGFLEQRGGSLLDKLPPPASSSKPPTPFSIEDILNKPSAKRKASLSGEKPCTRVLLDPTSPLCALEELASKTFRGLEISVLQAAEGRDGLTLFSQRNTSKKRRKSRTAFTNHQIYELEKRFRYQKYLSPADRDQIAQQLGLSNAQVITWFQNRRAKLKRDLEEMKADVESAKAAGSVALEKLSELAELKSSARGLSGGSTPGHTDQHRDQVTCESTHGSSMRVSPPACIPQRTDRLSSCSEDEVEDDEIDVDE